MSCSDNDEASTDRLTGIWKQTAQTRAGADDSYPCMEENTVTITENPKIFSMRIYSEAGDDCVLSVSGDDPWRKESENVYYIGEGNDDSPLNVTFTNNNNTMHWTSVVFDETVIQTFNRQQ